MFKSLTAFHRRCVRLTVPGFLFLALTFAGQLAARADVTLTNATFSSLQTAIQGGGTITLASDGDITTSNVLEIVMDTVLDASGHSVVLIGGGSNTLFYVDPGVHFTVINLILQSGNATGANGAAGAAGAGGGGNGGDGGVGAAGADGLGGGLYNDGITVLNDCIFESNTAKGGAGGAGGAGGTGVSRSGNGGNGGNGGRGLGGAIYNSASGFLLLTNCTFAGNLATGGAGGAGGTNGDAFAFRGKGGLGAEGDGAGLYNLGQAITINCTFNQNAAQSGATQLAGGANQSNGSAPNGSVGPLSKGGAVANFGTNSLVNCTFFLNTVTGGSGGNGGNSANETGGNGGNGGNGMGGGLFNGLAGVIGITNCTFATNSAFGGTNGLGGAGSFSGANGKVGIAEGANISNNGGIFDLVNTILSGSVTNNGTNSFGAISDDGNNISTDGTPAFSGSSFNHLDPKLGLAGLINNGGPTLTIALRPASPAIDAANDAASPAFDQRGVARPVGAHSDIGAFEFGGSTTNFSLSGTVTMSGNAVTGVTVKAGNATAISDTNGNFSFLLPAGTNYTVVPQPLGFFSPSSTNVILTANSLGNNFNATNPHAGIVVAATNTNTFQISFTGIPNFSYRIQASTNLVTWVNIATNSFDAGGMFTYTNSIFTTNTFFSTNVSTNLPALFFRAVSH